MNSWNGLLYSIFVMHKLKSLALLKSLTHLNLNELKILISP